MCVELCGVFAASLDHSTVTNGDAEADANYWNLLIDFYFRRKNLSEILISFVIHNDRILSNYTLSIYSTNGDNATLIPKIKAPTRL